MASRTPRILFSCSRAFSTCSKTTGSKTKRLLGSVNLHLLHPLPGNSQAKSLRNLALTSIPNLLVVQRKQSLVEAASLCVPVISKTAALSLAINDTEVTKPDESEDDDETTLYTLSGMEAINWRAFIRDG